MTQLTGIGIPGPQVCIPADEDDVTVLKNDRVKRHLLDIIQASHDLKDTSTREFPFTAKLWPQRLANACRNIWQALSNCEQQELGDQISLVCFVNDENRHTLQ